MKKIALLFTYLVLIVNTYAFAQSGMTVSPGKVFYYGSEGKTMPQKIRVINPTNNDLEVGISFNDWHYDETGSNKIVEANTLDQSCASWIRVAQGTHLSIPANSYKEIDVHLSLPTSQQRNKTAYTAMMFLTQLNPGNSFDSSGAAIKVAVRIGVKIYFTNKDIVGSIDIKDLKASKDDSNNKYIHLNYENNSSIWTDGKVSWNLFSSKTGNSKEIGVEEFYTLPGDKRDSKVQLPVDLPSGKYTITAKLSTDKDKNVQVAEMDFEL